MPEVENMLWKILETGDLVITRGGFFKKMTTDAAFVACCQENNKKFLNIF